MIQTIRNNWEQMLITLQTKYQIPGAVVSTWIAPLTASEYKGHTVYFDIGNKLGSTLISYLERNKYHIGLRNLIRAMFGDETIEICIRIREEENNKTVSDANPKPEKQQEQTSTELTPVHTPVQMEDRYSRDQRRRQKVSKTNQLIQESKFGMPRGSFNMLNYGYSKLKTYEVASDGTVVGLPPEKINPHIRIDTEEYCGDMLIPLEGGATRKQIKKFLDGIDANRFWIWDEETKTEKKHEWIQNITLGKGYYEFDFSLSAIKFACEHGKDHPYSSYEPIQLSFFKLDYTGRLFEFFNSYRSQGYIRVEYEKLRHMLGIDANKYKEFKVFKRDLIKRALKEIETDGEEFYVIDETPDKGSQPIRMMQFRIVERTNEEKNSIHYMHVRTINEFETKYLTKNKNAQSGQLTMRFDDGQACIDTE